MYTLYCITISTLIGPFRPGCNRFSIVGAGIFIFLLPDRLELDPYHGIIECTTFFIARGITLRLWLELRVVTAPLRRITGMRYRASLGTSEI